MISKRLKAISKLVEDDANIIDIGCDHALLDIYLTKNKNCKCIASDVNQNALDIAISNIKKYHLEDKIQTILSDGLENIKIDKPSTVVVAGMGTKTILKILDNVDDSLINKFVIASHNDYELLRQELSKKYHIINEVVIEDKNIFYLVLVIEKGSINYTKKEQYLGPVLKNKIDAQTKKYYQYLYNQNSKIIKKLSYHHLFKKMDLMKKNNWLKKTK